MAGTPITVPKPSAPSFRRACAGFTAASLALISFSAHSETVIVPAVTGGVTRTDNLRLAEGDEEGETVIRVVPALHLEQDSPRLRSVVDYRAEAYYYHGRSDVRVVNLLDAQTSVALDADNFVFDAGVQRSQSIRDPNQRLPAGNLSLSGNRIDRNDMYLSPSFQYALGSNVTARARATRNWTDYDEGIGVPSYDVVYDRATMSFDNFRRRRGVSWALRYTGRSSDYDVLPETWEYRQASVELGYWIGENVRLFGASGKESAWDQPFESSLEDRFWEAGLSAQAGEHLRAELAAGERSYGSSQRGALDVTFEHGSIGVRYSQTPTTQSQRPSRNRASLLDFLEFAELDVIDGDFLDRPGLADRYIANRTEVTVSLELGRATVSLSALEETREDRVLLIGTPLPDEKLESARAEVVWDVGRRTEVFVRARDIERDLGPFGVRKRLRASVGGDFWLGSRTVLSAELEYIEGEYDLTGRSFDVHMFTVLLTRSFGQRELDPELLPELR